uniref:Uncharacterized protein n=1 Tax=Gouania willdenowi TaxID=441366 RepID=A0A8C5H5T7_GOUWI
EHTADNSDENNHLRKLSSSSADTPSYHNLHRELLLSHKRGLVLEEKPELTRVLEQRRLELHKEEEMARQRPSDLETELRKRQQKLQEVRAERCHSKICEPQPGCSSECPSFCSKVLRDEIYELRGASPNQRSVETHSKCNYTLLIFKNITII